LRKDIPTDLMVLPCEASPCTCNGNNEGNGLTLKLRPRGVKWDGLLYDDDGLVVDVVRGDTAHDVMNEVHENYPRATSHKSIRNDEE
jgi:hypothetical protein